MWYVVGWMRPRGHKRQYADDLAHWQVLNGPYGDRVTATSAGEGLMGTEMRGERGEEWELVDYEVVHRKRLYTYGVVLSDYEQHPLPGLKELK